VGDPGLGFGGLRQFGSGLINHVRMKLRGGLNPALKVNSSDSLLHATILRYFAGNNSG
jgi:hypothetical protein